MTQINIKELEDGLKRYASTYEASRDLGFAAIYEAAKAYADQQWRPLVTMPHDGTWCQVWEKKYKCVRVARRGSGDVPTMGDWEYEIDTATHWMPLPLPPAPVSEGE